MAQTIGLPNYTTNNLRAMTRLDQDSAIGDSLLSTQNTAEFLVNDFVIVGTPGAETTELTSIQTITSKIQLQFVSGLQLVHNKYDYVYSLVGDSLKIYRALNINGLRPDISTFTNIDTVLIQPDRDNTIYVDPTGSDAYWYGYTFFNSLTLVESNLADSKFGRGGGSGDYCSLDNIRQEAGFKNAPYVTNELIDTKRKAAQGEINGTLTGFYPVPFTAPINDFISDICMRLAAGLLLLAQYGQINASNADGQTKCDGARDDLAKLVLKEIVLTDTNGTSLALPGSVGGGSSWPDATTDASNGTGDIDRSTLQPGQDAGHIFRMSDILGYTGRKF